MRTVTLSSRARFSIYASPYAPALNYMQIYHGSSDATLLPGNYQETVKQWIGVFGYNYDKPASTSSNTPQSSYTTTVYGPIVSGIYATGLGHTVPIRGADDMKFFGFSSSWVGGR